jgi:hypothetical protein
MSRRTPVKAGTDHDLPLPPSSFATSSKFGSAGVCLKHVMMKAKSSATLVLWWHRDYGLRCDVVCCDGVVVVVVFWRMVRGDRCKIHVLKS